MAVTAEGEQIQQYLMHQNECGGDPVIFQDMLSDWPASSWEPNSLVQLFGDELLTFRIGKKDCSEVQWENECTYVNATVSQFTDWLADQCKAGNPLQPYCRDGHWCYADYKYMAELFSAKPHILQMVDWSRFGFAGRNGTQSTFWLGSAGAYTVCHYDTYGWNLVAQIYGRKRWLLFPPSQTSNMYPTRIPYEESSVFSKVNIHSPKLSLHPDFQNVTPLMVTMKPGDVLFIPRHWWHFVESLDTTISVNTWIELDVDDHERVKEAVVRTVAVGLMFEDCSAKLTSWLNPTEDPTEHDENMEYLKRSLEKYVETRNKNSLNAEEPTVTRAGTALELPKHVSVKSVTRYTFEDYCKVMKISPQPENSESNTPTQCTCAKGSRRKCCVTSVDKLTTADVVNAVVQPAILDAIVGELEKRLLPA